MNILKTANGRLRIDPEAIRAIEINRPKWKEDDDRTETGVIVLEEGVELYASTEEVTEIGDQWEEYFQNRPDDQDEEDDDQDHLVMADAIDVSPGHNQLIPMKRRPRE